MKILTDCVLKLIFMKDDVFGIRVVWLEYILTPKMTILNGQYLFQPEFTSYCADGSQLYYFMVKFHQFQN